MDAAMAAILDATELVLDDGGVVPVLEAVLVVMSAPPAVTKDAGDAEAVLAAAAGGAAAEVVAAGADAVEEPRLGTDAGAPVEPVLM